MFVQVQKARRPFFQKGDKPGHPFRGNQHTQAGGAQGSAEIKSPPVPERNPEYTKEVERAHEAMTQEAKETTSDVEGLNEALYNYQSDGYKVINSTARSMGKGEKVDPELERDVKALDEAIASVSMQDLSYAADYEGEPIDLFRGVTNINEVQIGDTLSNQGFTSTTLDPLSAMEFSHSAGGVLGVPKKPLPVLRILGAKNGLPLEGNEKEILLGRGLKLKVTGKSSVNVDTGTIDVFDCEIIK